MRRPLRLSDRCSVGRPAWSGLAHLRARVRSAVHRRIAATVGLGLAALAAADHQRFLTHFVERQVPDLATPWFTR